MKKSSFIFFIFVWTTGFLFVGSLQKLNAQSFIDELDKNASPNTLTQKERKNGWKLLFNGEKIKEWRGYNIETVPDCWQVENGALKIMVKGGEENALGLISKKEYKNFALSLEFKLTKAANSGILYQVVEDKKYKYAYETGTEYQIIDDKNWKDKLEDWQISGANYAMYSPKVKPFKPVGEWNQVLLVVEGNNVKHYLNGKLVVAYKKHSDEWKKLRNSGKWNNYPDYGIADKGYIVLQNHGTQVYFRNIKIKEL